MELAEDAFSRKFWDLQIIRLSHPTFWRTTLQQLWASEFTNGQRCGP
jgi:hypothetical protein